MDAIGLELGRRVHRARLARRLSARQLGEAIGVSQQQVRRYETGADRMSAATLIRACSALGVSLAALCEGLDEAFAVSPAAKPAVGTVERLLLDFESIPQREVRAHLCRMVAAMSAGESPARAPGEGRDR